MSKIQICLCFIIFLYIWSSGSSREVVGQLESDCFSSDGRSKSSGICSPRASYLRKLADVASNGELLDWPKNDTRRFFHVVYRVGDLDRTIKFYTECFGMKVSRQRDVPKEKYSNAFMGFGSEKSHFAVELTYNYGVSSYEIEDGFGHFTISTQDVYKMVETVRAKGGNVTREPGPVEGGSSIIAIVKDPDGYPFELIQRGPTPEPFCQVMLRVGDLDGAIKFYEKALGMRLLRRIEKPEYKYTIGMMGYNESVVLELAYNYGVTEYKKGNAYAQIAIGTDDVYKSGEVVKIVNKELGGDITREPGPLPGIDTKIVSFLDPDGWKTVLVDNKDFMKELG
ncbi:lactoylglutathione lyase GLX1-like [Brassica napus]|uniref:lactoylglutathione lyase GLX1-like n=1 Tax=Brassica napus TaxID=3708 RepID=UPI002079DD77|nr:lactoylglutathione lyase GLX1-like [Brassica napus]